MCGRIVQALPSDMIRDLFDVTDGELFNFEPTWNGAPSQMMMAVRTQAGRRTLERMMFGMLPPDAAEPKLKGISTINAMCETVSAKPLWREPWASGRRCIVPADAWYEWRGEGADKEAVALARKDRAPLAFGAIWSEWVEKSGTGRVIPSFAILTMPARGPVADVHHRMPVILAEAEWNRWLSAGEIAAPVRALPAGELEYWRVHPDVGNWRNNRPDLIDPLDIAA